MKKYIGLVSIIYLIMFSCTMNNPYSATDYDFEPPRIVIHGVEDGGSFQIRTAITVDNESGVTYSYILNGEKYIPGTPILKTGKNIFKVVATKTSNRTTSELVVNFTIIDMVKVVTPNGDESYKNGEVVDIKWTANAGDKVNIELYKKSKLYSVIASSVDNTGSFKWEIPSECESAGDYKIKVTETTSGNSFYDFSDKYFSIGDNKYITLLPSSDESSLKISDWANIKWNTNVDAVSVKIALYKGGTFLQNIALKTPNDGVYEWTIPDDLVVGGDYTIKIVTLGSVVVEDTTEDFKVEPLINITSPSAGSIFTANDICPIKWSSNFTGKVSIKLYKGSDLVDIIVSTTDNTGSFDWSIPSDITVGTEYFVSVAAFDDSVIGTGDKFEIKAGQITVSYPDGGEKLLPENSYSIKWSSNFTGKVDIILLKDGVQNCVIANGIANTGSYNWSIPSSQPGGAGFKIKINSSNNQIVFDESNNTFEIDGLSIAIKKPNGGEKLYVGTKNDITWDHSSGMTGSVTIELYKDGVNGSKFTISNSTENDGFFEWDISESILTSGFMPGNDYKIMIKSTANQAIVDISDNPFELMLAPNIYFLLDNSGSMSTMVNGVKRIDILRQEMDGGADRIVKNFNVGIGTFSGSTVSKLLEMKKGASLSEFKGAYSSISATGGTPTGECLKTIRVDKLFELQNDVYSSYRKKAVVVITDGQPNDYNLALRESLNLSYLENVPVYYLGFSVSDSSGNNVYLENQLHNMAECGGTTNCSDSTKNWYPINKTGQFESALNDILYGDFNVDNTNVLKLELSLTPDAGKTVYFYGNIDILGNFDVSKAVLNSSGMNPAAVDSSTGKYFVYVRNKKSFYWGACQSQFAGSSDIGLEKKPLHDEKNPSPAFNGW